MKQIRYENLCKYKYRLLEELTVQCNVFNLACRMEYIDLQNDGTLTLRKNYAWNGASGPTVDTESSMRGSAGHDALYQLIELHAIPKTCRIIADQDLRRWCIEDGMSPARADYWYKGVRLFGGLFI